MKKLSLFILSLLIITVFTFAQSITVTSPNGGEDWKIDSSHPVTWTSSGVTGNIGIKLFKNGASLGYVAMNIPVSAGTYNWTIENVIAVGPISAGSNYQIQVKQTGVAGDLSNGNFVISPKSTPVSPASITVTSPNGGESWGLATSHNVKWTSTNVTGNVLIQLFKGGGTMGTIYSGTNSGIFSWQTGKYLGGTALPGSDYKIKINEIGSTVNDTSNNYFEILKAKPIMIVEKRGVPILPDLILDGFDCRSYYNDLSRKGTITVRVWLKNIGDRDIDHRAGGDGRPESGFYVAGGLSNSRGGFNGYSMEKMWNIALGKGKRLHIDLSFKMPSRGHKKGIYIPNSVFIFADSRQQLPEKNNNNNKEKYYLKNCPRSN